MRNKPLALVGAIGIAMLFGGCGTRTADLPAELETPPASSDSITTITESPMSIPGTVSTHPTGNENELDENEPDENERDENESDENEGDEYEGDEYETDENERDENERDENESDENEADENEADDSGN